MRHYAKENGLEYDLLNPRSRRIYCHKAKTLAEVKAGYRRKERATLKRRTADLVAEEMEYLRHRREFAEAEHRYKMARVKYDAFAEYVGLDEKVWNSALDDWLFPEGTPDEVRKSDGYRLVELAFEVEFAYEDLKNAYLAVA